jgi:hypothetical protein
MKKRFFFGVLFLSLFIIGCQPKNNSLNNFTKEPLQNEKVNSSDPILNPGVSNNGSLPLVVNPNEEPENVSGVADNNSNKEELEKMQKQLEASSSSLNSLDENQVLE